MTLTTRISRKTMVFALALVLAATCLAPECLAQCPCLWTQTGNNIKNTNSGNVGIGIDATVAQFQIGGTTPMTSGAQVNPTFTGSAGATKIGLQVAPTSGLAAGIFIGINAQADQIAEALVASIGE